MKTFKDLEFKKHPNAPHFDTQARMDFDNGYGVSVVNGSSAYCSGGGDYEVAVMKDGRLCYSTEITDDVLGYQSPDQIKEVMKQLQEMKA